MRGRKRVGRGGKHISLRCGSLNTFGSDRVSVSVCVSLCKCGWKMELLWLSLAPSECLPLIGTWRGGGVGGCEGIAPTTNSLSLSLSLFLSIYLSPSESPLFLSVAHYTYLVPLLCENTHTRGTHSICNKYGNLMPCLCCGSRTLLKMSVSENVVLATYCHYNALIQKNQNKKETTKQFCSEERRWHKSGRWREKRQTERTKPAWVENRWSEGSLKLNF